MNARVNDLPFDERPVKPPAYDPNNLHPDDEADRLFDSASEGIDWDEIIATTQDDVEAGRYAFTTEDYATHEEGMAALWKWLCSLGNGDSDEAGPSARDATRP
jgi:hypothetical protein